MSGVNFSIYQILFVEDNPADAALVRERLKDASGTSPFHVTHVSTLQDALDILQESEFHVILLDLNLPETTGLDTMTRIRSAHPGIPLVVLTVTEDEPLALQAIQLGAQDYIPKSQMNSVLLSRILRYAIEREKNDRSQRESESKYRLFVEGATGLAFILLDVEGHVIHWNSGAQRLFGYSDKEALNKYFSFLFPQEDLNKGRPEDELRRAICNEKGEDENWLVRKDGTRFWASGAVTAVRNSHDHLMGFAKVIRDTTEQKQANDKLAEINRTLEERVQQRTRELVRNQARLRNMASDLILTEQRERRRLASDLHDYLAQLLIACHLKMGQAQSLTEIQPLKELARESDDILDQAIEYTRTLVTQISPPSLYEFGLPAALVWLGSEMKKQGLHVEVHGGDVVVNLKEDQAILLYQSVRELLFNVLKHSGVQEAIVSLSIQEEHLLRIDVLDQGRGFVKSLEEREKDSSTKFGLFSIRERMEALGGSTTITSAPGQGTHIILEVPLEKISDRPDHSPKHPQPILHPVQSSAAYAPSGKIRVLLADDHKMVREGFCHILNAQADMEIVGEAEDGQQAVYLCRTIRPDVVVMDLHMPIMDGLEATKQIKQELPETTIIGLSVYDTPEIARWFTDMGASAFLTKGGPAEVLMNRIRQLGHQHLSS